MKDELEELHLKPEEPQNIERETNKTLNSQGGLKRDRLGKKQNREDAIGKETHTQSNGVKSEEKQISRPQKHAEGWFKSNFPPKMGVSVGLNNEAFFREGNSLAMKGMGFQDQEMLSKFLETTKRQFQMTEGMNR